MNALLVIKTFVDGKNGPTYEDGQIWIGNEDRADKIVSFEVAKEATVNDLKDELTKRGIDFNVKAKKDELIELLKGE